MDERSSLICIVEDDPTVRRALGRMVRSFGYKVELFGSALKYLEVADVDQPGCLILDVILPGMNGLELLATLQESGRKIPTVFISAYNNTAYLEKARLLGAVAYLQKPCEMNLLLESIEKALVANDAPSHE